MTILISVIVCALIYVLLVTGDVIEGRDLYAAVKLLVMQTLAIVVATLLVATAYWYLPFQYATPVTALIFGAFGFIVAVTDD